MTAQEILQTANRKWPVNGGEIIHSTDSEYISTIAEEVHRFEAEHGQGDELKERYTKLLEGKKIDFADAGFFALVGGVLIGGLTYHIRNEWVYLHCGYVWEQYRGMGVYAALMKIIEDTALYNNLSGIWVSTYEFEAPAVYEHMGFTKGTVLADCPRGNTAIDYYKYLNKPLRLPCRGKTVSNNVCQVAPKSSGMTNGEKIIAEITIPKLAQHIKNIYCNESKCQECPVFYDCNRIFDLLSGEEKGTSSYDVILYYLKCKEG